MRTRYGSPDTARISRRNTLQLAVGAAVGIAAGQHRGFVVAAPMKATVEVNGRHYDAYVPTATKQGQFFYYTCEFDAAWAVLQTFGHDVGFDQQLAIVGHDERLEPYVQTTDGGHLIQGGDITSAFSGDYTHNFLARTTGSAMKKLFEHFGLDTEAVTDRPAIEAALQRGAIVWMKATVDFLPWEPATWVTPDGTRLPTVLGNDHAVVVIGYNDDGVVIRDVLGPTDTNWARTDEYNVPWATFLAVFKAQGKDALAVGRPQPPT